MQILKILNHSWQKSNRLRKYMKYLMGLCQLKKDFYGTLMYRVEIDAMFRNIMAKYYVA